MLIPVDQLINRWYTRTRYHQGRGGPHGLLTAGELRVQVVKSVTWRQGRRDSFSAGALSGDRSKRTLLYHTSDQKREGTFVLHHLNAMPEPQRLC